MQFVTNTKGPLMMYSVHALISSTSFGDTIMCLVEHNSSMDISH